MNPKWFGDTYDIVKRFFASALHELDYDVYIDPMLTGDWDGKEERLYEFLKMRPVKDARNTMSALFLDPDTGIGSVPSPKHTTISSMVGQLETHEIVYSFDQSFSRGSDPAAQMNVKLATVSEQGAFGFYFDSHARFLFCSADEVRLKKLGDHLRHKGIPSQRLIGYER